MINEVILRIKQDKKLYNYLKYHSYWYYIVSYDQEKIKNMINEMKIELKETTEDKIIKFNKNIIMLKEMIDLLT